MDKIICSECGTENEPQYTYCKNCGALLRGDTQTESDKTSEENKQYNKYNENFNQNFNTPPVNRGFASEIIDNIDGVPTGEAAAFIGVKAPVFIKKFAKMHYDGTKVSWCWPVAILGLIFGPVGSAVWFFYRKMYKVALYFVIIGVVLAAVLGALSGINIDKKAESDVIATLESGSFSDYIQSEDAFKVGVADYINNAVDLLAGILSGLFGVYIYKNYMVKKINRFALKNEDPRYYPVGLQMTGGTSGGMAFLGVILIFITAVLQSTVENLIGIL